MGKPIGMGSVKINVDKVTIRAIDAELRYSETLLDEKEWPGAAALIRQNALYVEEFLKLTNFGTLADGKDVCYPIGKDTTATGDKKNAEASHQWFIANRSIGGTGIAQKIGRTLPEALDDDVSLPGYIKTNIE
jgi:hypothetical protein